MNAIAVIYARYSCDKQREQSIEDQLRVCRAYALSHGWKVMEEYCDKAMSGRSDDRPQFLKMVDDAKDGKFSYVIVYALDRFSRDQYDAPIYKAQLKKFGVRVVSATENIAEGPEGVLMEKIYEGMNAYYSLNLARSTRRGMNGNALECKANGYQVFGYDIDPDTQKYIVNDTQAEVVREVYKMYLSGISVNAISGIMARRGVKTTRGTTADYGFIYRILHNPKYTGVFSWGEVRIEDGMPAIIDKSTFRAVRKVKPKRNIEEEERVDYPLSGKLFCSCGKPMHGESANGTGGKYFYYACKSDGGCGFRIGKEYLEGCIADAIRNLVRDDTEADKIADDLFRFKMENGDYALVEGMKRRLKEIEKTESNIQKAIEQGIITKDTKERLDALHEESESIEHELDAAHRKQGLDATRDDIRLFLSALVTLPGMDDTIIAAFPNKVFLFDEGYAVVVMNYQEGPETELAEVRVALDQFEQYSNGAPNIFSHELLIFKSGIGIVAKVA